jgi:Ca-activated chloride channel family protein
MASTLLTDINFLYPYWLIGIPIIWISGIILLRYYNKNTAIQDNIIYQHTSINILSKTTEIVYRKNNLYFIIFLVGLSLSIITLARPQSFSDWIPEEPIGHEVVLLIDISQSMSIRDYSYKGKNITRFDVLKGIVTKFISDRPKDHFSIVVFSSKAATLVPMTKDNNIVKKMLDRLTLGLLGEETAIGDALALSIKQFRNDTKSRPLLIMFSDGDNTGGGINPSEALALANTLDFKIYTVAITSKKLKGSNSTEQEFKNLAIKTGGKYYHAKNSFSLQKIINDINAIEKTITPKPTKRKIIEWFYIPLLLSIIFITLSQLMVSRR